MLLRGLPCSQVGSPEAGTSSSLCAGQVSACEDDSEGDMLYSTEWDTSSAEEEEVGVVSAAVYVLIICSEVWSFCLVCCDRKSVAGFLPPLVPKPTTLLRSCSPLNKRASGHFLPCMQSFSASALEICVCVCVMDICLALQVCKGVDTVA